MLAARSTTRRIRTGGARHFKSSRTTMAQKVEKTQSMFFLLCKCSELKIFHNFSFMMPLPFQSVNSEQLFMFFSESLPVQTQKNTLGQSEAIIDLYLVDPFALFLNHPKIICSLCVHMYSRRTPHEVTNTQLHFPHVTFHVCVGRSIFSQEIPGVKWQKFCTYLALSPCTQKH